MRVPGFGAAVSLAILWILTAGGCGSVYRTPDLAIRDALLIDGTGAPPTPATIIINKGRIKDVLPPGDQVRAHRIIDATGRYVIPGLWDMHVHITGDNADDDDLVHLVRHGVTTVRDMGGHLDRIERLREEIREGSRVGPRILAAGPTLNGAEYMSFHRAVHDAREAREAVDAIAPRVDLIKVHREVPRDAFMAILDEAAKHGLKVAGHVPFGIDPLEACESGMAGMEHVAAILEAVMHRQENPVAGIAGSIDELLGPYGDRLAACMHARGVALTPTLETYVYLIAGLEDPVQREMTTRLLAKMRDIVRKLHAAGVIVMTGSDGPGPMDEIPLGASLHEELDQLVRSGLTPMEALQAATIVPARFMGLDEVGTLTPGMRADLLILSGNPLEAIANAREIETVIIDGHLIENDR